MIKRIEKNIAIAVENRLCDIQIHSYSHDFQSYVCYSDIGLKEIESQNRKTVRFPRIEKRNNDYRKMRYLTSRKNAF